MKRSTSSYYFKTVVSDSTIRPRGRLVKIQVSGSVPCVSDSARSGRGLRFCIFNQCPGNANVGGSGTTL